MNFSQLTQYFSQLEALSSRLQMTEILANFFKEIVAEQSNIAVESSQDEGEPNEIAISCYLMQGSLVPSYQSLEFQLSEKMLLRSLAKWQSQNKLINVKESSTNLFADVDEDFSSGLSSSVEVLRHRYKELGDMGTLFAEILAKKSAPKEKLSISAVYQQLKNIANTSGVGSQEKKLLLLVNLLKGVDPEAGKYLSRIILGKMRLGFATMTILDALSWAKTGDKRESATLESAFQKKADLGKLAESYLLKYKDLSAQELLTHYQTELGVPVVAALCQRLNSSQEIIEKMQTVLAEAKYDGLRVQIHFKRSGFANGLNYQAFTRNLENVSHMFPELAKLEKYLSCDTAIFDSEAIGINLKTGKFLPFQETIQRKRKHGIADLAAQLPIRFFIFDLLFLDGQQLIDATLEERKEKLAAVLTDSEIAEKTKYFLTSDPVKLHQFHSQQLAEGLEGAVMKKSASKYISGRKGWRWVKIKEEEGQQGKLSDTLDCVMMGYYFGKGKRQVFGIGALLVGIVDRDKEGNLQIKTISKIGTGLSDEQFREVKKLADQHLSPDNQTPAEYLVNKNLQPDVWLKPSLVLEIAADEITKSPIHSAGVALRFPRLERIRFDKSYEQATNLEELEQIKVA